MIRFGTFKVFVSYIINFGKLTGVFQNTIAQVEEGQNILACFKQQENKASEKTTK